MPGIWITDPQPPCPRPSPSLSADVKFISNPPSMVAAGSVVAAMQGLHLGSPNNFLSCYRLTHFLSRVIKCDPVSDPHRRHPAPGKCHGQGPMGGNGAVRGGASTRCLVPGLRPSCALWPTGWQGVVIPLPVGAWDPLTT